VGETASTGVHGANRLASNSLLECLVFGKRSVDHAVNFYQRKSLLNYHEEKTNFVLNEEGEKDFSAISQKIANLLWQSAGIIRNEKELRSALNKLDTYIPSISEDKDYYSFKKRCLMLLAQSIIKSALLREESRGCHLRSDFPEENSKFRKTIILQKNNEPGFTSIKK
jgi:L-aspartate oxidase